MPLQQPSDFAMDPNVIDQRLSRISTLWTLVQQAHAGISGEAADAKERLMQRYCGAAYRYLLGALRDEDAAMEMFQEFAMRFVRGDFRNANAERGRFRDYVKTALRHLVTDYHRQRQVRPVGLPSDLAAPARDEDDEFLASWREELLSKSWESLAAAHPPLHAVLLAHAEQPDASAAELAVQLTDSEGRSLTAGNVRVMLHRARTHFAELLSAEVTQTLATPSEAELIEELRALRLLKLCRPVLDRHDSVDAEQL